NVLKCIYQENEFADDFMDVLNDEESLPEVSLDDMNVDEQEEKLIDTVKKSDMKTNYVLRSGKERKKRLVMALESPFGQQPPTTPVSPKRISRNVNCDFIMPPDFEEHIDLWVDLMWCFRKPDTDWAMVSPLFLPCTLGGNMIDCYSNSVRYPIAWRDVEKVYFSVNEPNRNWCLA
nr:phospholipase-like protein [Tanacetum cinerariifolium]